MKKFTILFKSFLLVTFLSLFMQNTFAQVIRTSEQNETELRLLQASELQLRYLNEIGFINTEFVNIENIDYARLVIPAYTKSTIFGNPELPVRRKLIEIPFGATPNVKIINYDLAEYKLSDYGIESQLLPLQLPVPKCGDSPEYICNAEVYNSDVFINQELVSVDILGVMRGTRIARVNISPIFYNPLKNTIRVYENLEFEINFEGADLALTQAQKEKYYSPYFSNIFSMFENYTRPESSRDNFTSYPIKYVIVSDRMFESQLQPFINWKTKKGFTVVVDYTDDIGNSKPEIKSYIQGLYDAGTPEDPAPSFVLFVGDVAQIPTYDNGDGVTDRNYFECTGDLYPDIFYGRFSANNATELQPYIDKTLQYEQYTMPDPSFLGEVVMIAGMDGSFGSSHGNGQINYGTINYFNAEHDIISHTYLYPNSGSNAANIKQNISDGVSFANYTAHCSSNGWGDPSFTISDISSLQNQDEYGLLIGNCCLSSTYGGTCFGEEILRAENKGAVGYIGGSNSTYWDEDFWFGVGATASGAIAENPPPYEETGLGVYDRSFHDNAEPFEDWFTTMDQVVYAGNLAVSEAGSNLETYYWDIYNLMGDPSLMIYYGVPDEMPVLHDDELFLGQTTLSVDAVPYAYISVTLDNVIKGVALADQNGQADIELDEILSPEVLDIVATAQNYQPYISTIQIIPDGVYARFTADDVDVCTDNSIVFTNQSLGSNTSWEWTFEGGTPATYSGEIPPPIVYETAGSYDVALEVSDGADTDTELKENYITVLNNVMADFDTDITTGDAPLTIQFNDLSSEDVDSWHWDFGNGGTSGLQNPTYTYYQAGTYTISLTIEGNGCENIEVKEDYITVTAAAPEPDFTSDYTYGPIPFTVNFTDMSDGIVDTWLWDFGDGNTSDEQNPEHIFTDEDYFDVSLTVTGPGGTETMAKEDFINTLNLVSVTVSASPDEVCLGEESLLNAEAEGGSETYTYSWTSDPEGFVSDEESPMVSPEVTTTYMVEVTDGEQLVSGEIVITVNPLPEITLGDWPEQLCNQQEPPVQLTATPEGGTYSGDHVTAEGVFSPEEATVGWHVITYTYEDENGCENMKQDSVFVDACLSFGENGSDNGSITIYPNPFNDILNIKTTLKDIKVKVMTLDGKTILDLDLMDNNTSVDLSQLNSGIYIVYFENDQTNTFHKIIKR